MGYEFDGKKYETASAHQKEWGVRLIDELDLVGSEHVLDLGCGDGALSARIADLVPDGQVVGIDASRGMIEVAKQKEKGNLRFFLMDIDEIAFVDQFDVAISNATLHWVKDHPRLYTNVMGALRKDGVVRFNFAAHGNCSVFFKVIREAITAAPFSRYFAGFQWPWYMPVTDDYLLIVEQSGLRDVRVWGENADRFFPDEETMIKWVDQPSLVPFLKYIPESEKAEFRQFVVARMIEETKQDDGRCFETFRRINVFGRK